MKGLHFQPIFTMKKHYASIQNRDSIRLLFRYELTFFFENLVPNLPKSQAFAWSRCVDRNGLFCSLTFPSSFTGCQLKLHQTIDEVVHFIIQISVFQANPNNYYFDRDSSDDFVEHNGRNRSQDS